MGLAYIEGAGGGGVRSSDVTASAADILAGKYDLTADSDDEVVQGTMPDNGTVNHTLPINGTFNIPAGYHSGSGQVTQNITTKAAATYYAGTSDQTIAAGQYLSGAQTIKKLTQTNLSVGNVKNGVQVTVNNGNTNVYNVTGTLITPSEQHAVFAFKGFGASSSSYVLSDEITFTMPKKGRVYYDMTSAGVGSDVTIVCELSVNNVVKASANITNWNYSWRNVVDKSIAVNANDVVHLKVTVSGGQHAIARIQTVVAY